MSDELQLVQVQVSVVFAPVTADGIGALTAPVQITVPASEFNTLWATDRSREVIATIIRQLHEQTADSPVLP